MPDVRQVCHLRSEHKLLRCSLSHSELQGRNTIAIGPQDQDASCTWPPVQSYRSCRACRIRCAQDTGWSSVLQKRLQYLWISRFQRFVLLRGSIRQHCKHTCVQPLLPYFSGTAQDSPAPLFLKGIGDATSKEWSHQVPSGATPAERKMQHSCTHKHSHGFSYSRMHLVGHFCERAQQYQPPDVRGGRRRVMQCER